MLLQDMLVQLQSNIHMRRESWKDEDGYLSLMPGMTHIWKIVLITNPNAGNYIFSLDDLLADDWVIFKVKKQVVDDEIVAE